MLKQFYVYLWLRQDGTPYYVGKSQDDRNKRAFTNWGHNVPCPKDSARIIVQYYESETDALEAERFFISLYGRADLKAGHLRNLTDGGEGISGAVRTEKWKRNIGLGNKGRKPVGYTRTEEHRRQLRERMKNGGASKAGRIGGERMASTLKERFTLEQRQAWSKKVHAARWGRQVPNSPPR
jgi:hypothetical protein